MTALTDGGPAAAAGLIAVGDFLLQASPGRPMSCLPARREANWLP